MVYKLYSSNPDDNNAIEFIETATGVLIATLVENDGQLEEIHVTINKDSLFELIGGLLRIQSKLKG